MAQARLEMELVGKQWTGEVESVVGMVGRRQTVRGATFDAIVAEARKFLAERALPAPLLSAGEPPIAAESAPQKPAHAHTKK